MSADLLNSSTSSGGNDSPEARGKLRAALQLKASTRDSAKRAICPIIFVFAMRERVTLRVGGLKVLDLILTEGIAS